MARNVPSGIISKETWSGTGSGLAICMLILVCLVSVIERSAFLINKIIERSRIKVKGQRCSYTE